jgi:hypothetical protein
MRAAVLIGLAACGSTAGAPIANPAAAGSACTVDAGYWTDSEPIDPQAPIAVVFGDNGWGGGGDRPAIAVWPDGEILDDDKVGHITPARAAEIAHAVADALRDVEPRLSLTDGDDLPRTLIAARDGKRWRVVRVRGLTYRGVRAVAYVRATNDRPDRAPPDTIMRALAALFALDRVPRPADYTPVELVLAAGRIAPNTPYAAEWPGSPLDWPANWPAPPPSKDGDTFDLVVPGNLAREVDAFAAKMGESQRPVRIRGANWMFYVSERYRGEAAFEAAKQCADGAFVDRWNTANPR